MLRPSGRRSPPTEPSRSSRTTRPAKHPHPFDPAPYRLRNVIERMFCRLKDFRRIATRYDRLARNFASAIALIAVVLWWT